MNLFVFLRQGFEGETSFEVGYKDSAGGNYSAELRVTGKEAVFPFVDKMAHHQKLRAMCDTLTSKG